MTYDGRKPKRERLKYLCCLLFIVYVERSTDAAANEKAREERETVMHTWHLMKVKGEATVEDAKGGAGKIKKGEGSKTYP